MNVITTIVLILLAVIVTLAGIIQMFHKKNKSLETENKQMSEKIVQLNKNIVYLLHHSQELAQIQKDKEKTFQRIEETRTDEEIADIVSVIVNSNNERVQNVPEK